MKTFMASLFAVLVALSVGVGEAEAAKRLGGGKSFGMQRDSVKREAPAATPAAPATPAQAAPMQQAQAGSAAASTAAAAAPKRSWLGPVAGLAAGLGLAALASHFGFGEGLANFLMIALLVLAAVVVFRLIFRRRQQPAMQYAGATAGAGGASPLAPSLPSGGAVAEPASGPAAKIPSGFDVEAFTRQAKLNFIRLQAANDSGNLDDLREFTSPEMFAEIRMQIAERGGQAQVTDVVTLSADVLEVVEEAARYVVSVRFTGLVREEDAAAPAPLDEIWHLTKPTDGSRGWVIAGIQQCQ